MVELDKRWYQISTYICLDNYYNEFHIRTINQAITGSYFINGPQGVSYSDLITYRLPCGWKHIIPHYVHKIHYYSHPTCKCILPRGTWWAVRNTVSCWAALGWVPVCHTMSDQNILGQRSRERRRSSRDCMDQHGVESTGRLDRYTCQRASARIWLLSWQ